MSQPDSWEKNHGFDETGHERRQKRMGVVACPVCRSTVDLIADTEEWTQGDDGRWQHNQYGPAQGVCCDRLIVDSFDGCKVYDLRAEDDTDEWVPAEYGGEG